MTYGARPRRRAWRAENLRRVLAAMRAEGDPPPHKGGREAYWRRIAARTCLCADYARRLYKEARRAAA